MFEISAANAKEKYPLLYEMVFYRNDYSCASRQTQLKEIGPEPLVDYIFKWWQDNATQFVPHPASAHKANYHTHADWLAVVHELNPIKANDLLNKWRKEHKRKKNLWKAIAEKGL